MNRRPPDRRVDGGTVPQAPRAARHGLPVDKKNPGENFN
jgi:hypothetical protein